MSVPPTPISCFWELTRRCELRCLHCRAGDAAGDELDLEAALAVADQLAALRVRLVVLTGGEPILHPGWAQIARRLADAGVRVRLFISGMGFDRDVYETARHAGVTQFAVSLDGPREIHDRLRPPGEGRSVSAFAAAAAAVRLLVGAEAAVRVVTQINRLNAGEIEHIYRQVAAWGVRQWQVALCQMTGRAAARRGELAPDPLDLEEIVRVLLLAAREKVLTAPLHCTVGYLTREEPVLRNRERHGSPVWQGCDAARRTLALTPGGGVKGCTALPDEFVVASLRDRPLAEIWADDARFPYARQWTRQALADLCAVCAFGGTCRAGCPAVAYGATGSIGANPFCLRIARQL